MASQDTLPMHRQFSDLRSLDPHEFEASVSSGLLMPTTGSEGITSTPELLFSTAEIMQGIERYLAPSIIDDKENVCPFERSSDRLVRCSPLPWWYPRRPLQDITGVLNTVLMSSGEVPVVKKVMKKAQGVGVYVPASNGTKGRVMGKLWAPTILSKHPSSVASAVTKSSKLRKGFR